MILDEITVENAGATVGKAFRIECHEVLHDALQRCDIAADLHLIVSRCDRRERGVPRNWQVSIGSPIVGHWMRQTTLILKIEVRPLPEFADCMRGEKFWRRPFGRCLP